MLTLRIGSKNAWEIYGKQHVFLRSYGTIVAVYDKRANETLRCEERYSVTTSKHLGQWCHKQPGALREVPQSEIQRIFDQEQANV